VLLSLLFLSSFPRVCSVLLISLIFFLSIFQEFDVGLLEDCILIGVERTLQFTSRRMSLEVHYVKRARHFIHSLRKASTSHLLFAILLNFVLLQEAVIRPYDNTEHFESTGVDHLLLSAKLTIFRNMYHVVQDVMMNIPCEGNHGNQSNLGNQQN
jgi:hypothetical protein